MENRLTPYLPCAYVQRVAVGGPAKGREHQQRRKIQTAMKILFALLFIAICDTADGQIISTFAGNGSTGNSGDGSPATAAQIDYPIGGVFDRKGNYYFALGTVGNCIRKISPSGIITTVAGNSGMSGFSGDGGQATAAQLHNPQAITVDTSGNLFIADASNHRIRKVDIVTGIINTVTGNGTATFSGDGGPATSAKINYPLDLCVDVFGNLIFADAGNARIRRITPSGIISTVGGTGTNGVGTDSIAATASKISTIQGIFADDTGNVFIGDIGRIRKIVASTGMIYTIAGSTAGSSGDGGSATAAHIVPTKLARDKFNNIYIAETGFNKIRKINSTGIISTICGTGVAG